MPTCIYHKDTFAEADGEHILQNFLGARWASDQIVCNELQSHFSTTIDSALEQGLRPIRVLLGTRGGRGEDGPTIRGLTASTGEKVDLQPGGQPRLAEPMVQVDDLPDGRKRVRIQLGTPDHAGWALHKLRGQVPTGALDGMDKAKLLAEGREVEEYLTGQVPLTLTLGGPDYFRGMLKSCLNLLGALLPQAAVDGSLDAVRRFISLGEGQVAPHVRWSTSAAPLTVPRFGAFDHFIGIVSRDGVVEGVAQFFGCVVHPFRLGVGYGGPPIHCGYLVDPTREADPAEDRSPAFTPDAIPDYGAQSEVSNNAVWSAFSQRMQRCLAEFYKRADQQMIGDVWDEVMGPPDGRPITKEDINRLSARLAEQLVRRYYRPGSMEK